MSLLLSMILASAAALYTLSAVAHLFYMARRDFDMLARWATRGAWLTQTFGILLLVYETGRTPVYTLFEFTSLFTWVVTSHYIVIEVWRRNQAAGSFLTPAIALLQVFTIALPKPTPELSIANQFPVSLIGWHVGVLVLGYGSFLASFVAGALYLLQERNLRLKRWSDFYHRMPSLEALDIWGGRFVYLGFPLLTIGMVAGMSFAHLTWVTFWQSDPKVIFTVFVWLVYAGYLLMRKYWGWGGRRAAWWSVVGVSGLFINYFIINLVSGLHRFGV